MDNWSDWSDPNYTNIRADMEAARVWMLGRTGFGGTRIFESIHITIPAERTVIRSWKERLFSWPWRPWQATKVIVEQVPSPNLYRFGQDIVGHPQTIRLLKEQLAQEGLSGDEVD